MGKEIFEVAGKEEDPLKIINNLEIINKALLKKNSLLEGNLEISENSLEDEQAHSKALKKDLNDSQDALWKIREIIDKLKTDSSEIYKIDHEDLKYIQELLYDQIKDKARDSYR